MAHLVLEGTWEEIIAHAPELAGTGKQMKLLVPAEEHPKDLGVLHPNKAMLQAMREAEEIQRGMNPKPGSDAVAIIREGRAGELYGDSAAE